MRVIRQILFFTLLSMLAVPSYVLAQAQQARGSVTGIVTNAGSLRPLSSAQVFIEGTGFGGITNANGRYLIANVPVGTHTVRVTLIGYTALSRQVTVSANTAANADFTLEEEALSLDAIVVTGTAGQARQREVGNQIAQIDVADVIEPVADLASMLQGRTAGSRIALGSGNVASGPDIRLRGNVSAALSNQPLIYLDGVRVQSEPITTNNGGETPYSPLNDINPDDIERIEIVKGPAATTLYGTEAAAGVIQIFTKRGGQGAPIWTAEITEGFSYFRNLGPECPAWINEPNCGAPTMWLGQVFRKGTRQRGSMSVRGGTPDLGYFVSGAYSDNLGAVETEYEKRLNLRANTTFRPHEDLLVQFNSSLSQADYQQAQMGNSVTSIMMTGVRGQRNYMSGRRDRETMLLLLSKSYVNDVTRVTTGMSVTYTPGADFTHRLNVGYDYAQDDHEADQPHCWLCPIGINSDFSDFVQGGQLNKIYSKTVLTSLDYVGTLGFNLGASVRNTFSFGAQALQTDHENGESVGRHFPGPGEYTLSTAATRWDIAQRKLRVITGGFFGQNMMALNDRYFVTVGLRVDGNSAFGETLGFQFYPKVSGSWVMSDEAFWPDAFGQLKLRGAYGLAGRAPGAFDKVKTWDPVGFGQGQQAFYPQNLGNDALGPERTREIEIGFDGGWFSNRLSADLTYYRQTTTEALFEVDSPASEGGWNSQLENVGKIQNQGFEINTNATLLNLRNLRWELGVGVATNKSTVLDLGGTPPFSVGSSGWVYEGQPLPVIYDYKLHNPYEKADPQFDWSCPGAAGAPPERTIAATAPRAGCLQVQTFFGPANPNRLYSATTTIGLPKGLQLSARGELSMGGWISNNFESNALSRTVAHPKCWEAYHKVDPNWMPGSTDLNGDGVVEVPGEYGTNAQPNRPATRPADMYAWEWLQCFGQARGGYNMQRTDYAELRDLTLLIPVSSLLPSVTGWASRVDLTISGRNVAKWLNKDLTSGHPEQDENSSEPNSSGEFRHDFVRAIQETLPPQSFFTVQLRAVF